MPNVEWQVAQKITSSLGELRLNDSASDSSNPGRCYLVDSADYKIVPSLRVTQDNLSMFDGSILHPRWKTGLVATMRVLYTIKPSNDSPDYLPACGEDLREMHELLMSHLDALRVLHAGANQRYQWTPTGYGQDRMLTDVQCLAWAEPTHDGAQTEVTFALETPFPYAIDFTQQTQTIADLATETITNPGSADFYPVIKVHGPSIAFVVVNGSVLDEFGVPLYLEYDGTRPGAHTIASGHFIEFDFFRGTAFLDGDVDDRMAGVVPTTTDFFPLRKGANDVALSGANHADVLWNPAYS